MKLPSSRAYASWLALVRILTGAIWLIHGVPKFLNAPMFMPPSGLVSTYLQEGLQKSTGPYHDFLASVVAPNLGIFAELVRLGEVCVGISLLLGLFTRVGGFFGIVLALNYIAVRGGLGHVSEWGGVEGCLALLSATSLIMPTGRVLGLDAMMRPRAPRRERVVAEVVPERPLNGPTAPP